MSPTPCCAAVLQEAERKVEQAQRDRQRHLAQITNLKAALREAVGRSEQVGVAES